jgi:hypothetical protein
VGERDVEVDADENALVVHVEVVEAAQGVHGAVIIPWGSLDGVGAPRVIESAQ